MVWIWFREVVLVLSDSAVASKLFRIGIQNNLVRYKVKERKIKVCKGYLPARGTPNL